MNGEEWRFRGWLLDIYWQAVVGEVSVQTVTSVFASGGDQAAYSGLMTGRVPVGCWPNRDEGVALGHVERP